MGYIDSASMAKQHLLPSSATNTRSITANCTPRRNRSWVIGTILLFGMIAWSQCRLRPGSGHAHPHDIYNRTLGFQRTFAISFPKRTDKRDSLVLAASLTEWDFEWSEGVAFDDIDPKAAPVNWDYAKRTKGALGCWRAHINVLQKIVHDRVQSALIIEDDADWDISLKHQLFQFATGVRVLQKSTPTRSLRTAYGNDWDFLWLGQCKLGTKDHQSQFYIIENDPTVPPIDRRHGKWANDHIPNEVLSNTTRLIFPATRGGLCMYAYAITFEGAQKALAALSIVPRDDVIDMSYRRLCAGEFEVEMRCFGSYPTVFGAHRAAGPQNRDSDLNEKGARWHKEYSFDVVYSVQQNVVGLVAGDQDVKAQWPGDVEEARRVVVDDRVGIGRVVDIDLRALPSREVVGINR